MFHLARILKPAPKLRPVVVGVVTVPFVELRPDACPLGSINPVVEVECALAVCHRGANRFVPMSSNKVWRAEPLHDSRLNGVYGAARRVVAEGAAFVAGHRPRCCWSAARGQRSVCGAYPCDVRADTANHPHRQHRRAGETGDSLDQARRVVAETRNGCLWPPPWCITLQCN